MRQSRAASTGVIKHSSPDKLGRRLYNLPCRENSPQAWGEGVPLSQRRAREKVGVGSGFEASPERRYSRERDFHDNRYAAATGRGVAKYYTVSQGSRQAFYDRLASGTPGGRALDCGCGRGYTTQFLAKQGYQATGIDLSSEAVRQARQRAVEEGADVDFAEMNVEALVFEDNSFDIVCGRAILHHLILDRAYREIARVLEPDGRAVFLEPLGHNPLINLYRRMTRAIRTVDEQPLYLRDIRKAKRHFGHIKATFFDLSTLVAVPFRNAPGFDRVLHAMEALDTELLGRPRLRRFAWHVLIELEQPYPD